MKKQPKQKENRRAKKTEIAQEELYEEEQIPKKDEDGIDIISNQGELSF